MKKEIKERGIIMSCYTSFFIRRGEDFIPIGTYSRNSAIARAFSENHFSVPWEKISPLTKKDISNVIDGIVEMKDYDNQTIAKYEKRIEEIKKMEASLSERLEMIDEYESYIKEVREDLEEWEHAHSYLVFLDDIIDEIKYSEYEKDKGYDADNYIYFGLEIGSPTVNDIV